MFPSVLILFFLFGTIIGSFLNVVILRYGTDALAGRSYCFSCRKTLRWFELVPLASFLLQRGRCRSCRTRISLQYPLVELVTGLVFVAVAWKNLSGFSSFSFPSTIYLLLSVFFWSLLITLSVYDIRHKIIPNGLVYAAALIALALFLLRVAAGEVTHLLLDATGGFLFAAPFAALWVFSRGRVIGLGDAKLLLSFSWFAGFSHGLSALIIGFWAGAALALVGFLVKASAAFLPIDLPPHLHRMLRSFGMKSEMPLGPFLVFGLFLVYLFGWDVTGLGLLLQPIAD